MTDYICASPRREESSAYLLLRRLQKLQNDRCAVRMWDDGMGSSFADTAVLSFPLYVDGLPAQLLCALRDLPEGAYKRIYALCTCGFYEGAQIALAFETLRNFCLETGRVFCGGLGVGAGGLICGVKYLPDALHPHRRAFMELRRFSLCLSNGAPFENAYTDPAIPRRAYMFFVDASFRRRARRAFFAAGFRKNAQTSAQKDRKSCKNLDKRRRL